MSFNTLAFLATLCLVFALTYSQDPTDATAATDAPADPTSPADTTAPADPTAAADTSAPADPTSPADTAAPADPTAAADTSAPADPTTSADTSAPAGTTGSVDPSAPPQILVQGGRPEATTTAKCTKCTPRPTDPSKPCLAPKCPKFVCPSADVCKDQCNGAKSCLYPHCDAKNNPGAFIKCTANNDCKTGTPEVLCCPEGLWWNDKIKECDWPYNCT